MGSKERTGEGCKCAVCGVDKLYCKGMCRNCYEKSLRARNMEYVLRQRENATAWRKAHPEWVADANKRRKEDPYCRERDKRTKRKGVLRKRGLTEESLKDLYAFQNNCCAICGRPFAAVGAVHIDHDHHSGRTRGLLCSRCNNGIGMLGESVDALQKAIDYLQNPVTEQWGKLDL